MKTTLLQHLDIVWHMVLKFRNRLSGIKVSKDFWKSQILTMSNARATKTCKMDDFLRRSKKVVRIVLYEPAISQSDHRKTSPYQLPFNNIQYC